ncbi:glycosyltransferase family 2 protein [Leptolyngbya sp. FACHB-261]|uniref:glycosyltransferase family 2 protein n=1 Tax=Leptolyngbya sp. FACHB-261 TaxID=2692806 RepID=UPI001682DC5F|nr:glycosyltransferase family 2 protein [Leptolyngbya sp. FACHB-261]MBD2099629.1 glycosyltransferase [Leptolyngbya sp. FACHB-261]
MRLRFSVITPSFCQGQFIERTIQSVLDQRLPKEEYEYIVCDGGSKDETIRVLQHYNQHIKWISEPDKGQADAVNKGILMTAGDIIAWINSDDVYYPNTFEEVREIFEKNPDVQALYGDADHIDEQGQIIGAYPTEPWDYKRLVEICYLCQPAVFFRRSLVENLGTLDSTLQYCMDYELWLRYGQYFQFYYLRKKLAGSRLYASNKTLSQREAVHHEINDMLHQKFNSVPDRWILGYAYIKSQDITALEQTDQNQGKHIADVFLWASLLAFLYWRKYVPPKIFLSLIKWWFNNRRAKRTRQDTVESIRIYFT